MSAGYMVLFVYLLIMAVCDVKTREIHIPVSLAAAIMLLAEQLYFILRGEQSVQSILLGMLIGGVLILISVLTGGQIGVGDGILFLVSGLVFGFYENTVLLFLSLLFTSFASGVLILIKHVDRKFTLPFAPFVLAGYGVMCVWKIFV